jgi:hypothetical protein
VFDAQEPATTNREKDTSMVPELGGRILGPEATRPGELLYPSTVTITNSFNKKKSRGACVQRRLVFLRLYSRSSTLLYDGIIIKYLLPKHFKTLKEKVLTFIR